MDAKSEIVTGGCLCGALRYEISEPPNKIGTCHCRKCQRWSGSAFSVGARFPKAAVHFIKGEPKVYQSSSIMVRGFCADCGSPLVYWYLAEEMAAGNLWISLGTLDQPDAFSPAYHYGVESEMAWLHDDLPRHRIDEDSSLASAWKSIDGERE